MPSLTQSIDVNVDVSKVYRVWSELDSLPQFMTGVDQVTAIDDTHQHWKTSIGGIRREFDTVITEQRPDERVGWKSDEGLPHTGLVTFERLGPASTRVTVQLDWQPSGLLEKLVAVIGFDARTLKSDLAHFKTFIESRR
jgi:uncharacterized membrane protein